MKVERCQVGLTYEGINKIFICDLILEESEAMAMVVFEWEIQPGMRRAKVYYRLPIHDLQSTGDGLYSINAILNVDDADSQVRAYLLKNYFGLD